MNFPFLIWVTTPHVGVAFVPGPAGDTRFSSEKLVNVLRAFTTSARLAFGPAFCIAWNSSRPDAHANAVYRSGTKPGFTFWTHWSINFTSGMAAASSPANMAYGAQV